MAPQGKAAGKNRTPRHPQRRPEAPRSAKLAANGLRTTEDVAEFFALLIDDTISGRVTVELAGAICNAGGKALKAVELQGMYNEGRSLPLRRGLLPRPPADTKK